MSKNLLHRFCYSPLPNTRIEWSSEGGRVGYR